MFFGSHVGCESFVCMSHKQRMQQKFRSECKSKHSWMAPSLEKPHVPMPLRVLSLPTLAWKLSRCVHTMVTTIIAAHRRTLRAR